MPLRTCGMPGNTCEGPGFESQAAHHLNQLFTNLTISTASSFLLENILVNTRISSHFRLRLLRMPPKIRVLCEASCHQ